jgi:hypothetical protein
MINTKTCDYCGAELTKFKEMRHLDHCQKRLEALRTRILTPDQLRFETSLANWIYYVIDEKFDRLSDANDSTD